MVSTVGCRGLRQQCVQHVRPCLEHHPPLLGIFGLVIHGPHTALFMRQTFFYPVAVNLLEFLPHAVAPGLTLKLEGTATRLAADKNKTQKGEGLRPSKTTTLAVSRCIAAKVQQPRLVQVQRKRKLLQPRMHCVPEAPRVGFVLEANNDIIRIARNLREYISASGGNLEDALYRYSGGAKGYTRRVADRLA